MEYLHIVKYFVEFFLFLLQREFLSHIIESGDCMNNLRVVRKSDPRKLTQKDVADFLGADRSTYAKYETGDSEPNLDTLIRLSNFFGVSLEYLIGQTDIKKALSAEALSVTPEAQALHEVMESLSPEDRQRVLDFGRALAKTAQKPKPQK